MVLSLVHALFLTRLFQLATNEVLNVGGIIQNTGIGARGKAAFDLWADWANSPQNTNGFTVELTWFTWTESLRFTTVIPILLNNYKVHVIICPYFTREINNCVRAVPANSNIPILVWGGAADSIFTHTCQSRKCYGTLTVASEYMVPCLEAIQDAAGAAFTVGTITNNNTFNKLVDTATRTWIAASSDGYLVNRKTITLTAHGSSLALADSMAIDGLLVMAPDVITIAGDPGDVEEVIKQIRNHPTYQAKAIVATNAFNSTLGSTPNCDNCDHLLGVIMPDQWAESPTMADSKVGWTTEIFKVALSAAGQIPSYHAASAAAAAIALTHAMAAGTVGERVSTLADHMERLSSIETFYGKIGFNADGSLRSGSAEKPMYGRQFVSSAPFGTKVIPPNSNLVYPLADLRINTTSSTTSTIPPSPDLTVSQISECTTLAPLRPLYVLAACLLLVHVG